jgi:hypothetical protein
MKIRDSWIVAFSLTCAAPAFAGLVDTPLAPAFKQLVYSVTGVRNAAVSPLATIFSCTSTAIEPITVGVDVFNNAGALVSPALPLPVAPGQTVVFATAPGASYAPDQVMPVPAIIHGSARIVSTSKSLICSAAVVDVAVNPPRTMSQLTIVAKTKQKAAN